MPTRDIRTNIVLEGEQQYKKQLDEAAASVRLLGLQVKENSAVYKLNQDSVTGNLEKMSLLKKEMEAQLADIKTKLKTELTNKINEASGGALSQFGSLDDIKNKLTGSVGQAKDYENKLNQKRSEAEKQMKGKAEEATKKATQQATDNAKKELGNQLKKLF